MKAGIGAFDRSVSRTGLGTLVGHLVPELMRQMPEAHCFAIGSELSSCFHGRVDVVRPQPFPKGWRGAADRLLAHQTRLKKKIRQAGLSIYYSTDHQGILWPGVGQVITLLDLIPLHYEDAHPKLRRYFEVFLPFLLRHVRGVVCISEATRQDFLSRFRFPAERVRVALLGCDHSLFHPPNASNETGRSVRDPYFLFVAALAPHKNLLRAVEALARVEDRRYELVVVGEDPRGMQPDIRLSADRLGLGSRVRFVGPSAPRDLARWYFESAGLVFPSVREGFGLPALEAMASGCPVIASNNSSLPEVCGPAALYVDPLDVGSISRAMNRIVWEKGLGDELRRRGLERAAGFTWRRTAETIIAFLREIDSGGGSQA